MIGLARGTVRLAPYSQGWAALFHQEQQLLNNALGELALDIQL
jgi:GrpB-like predicted nucleotidyltransferase (UPF0157 family)